MAHIPVLLNEVLKYLDPRENQNFIDATVGDGGHAKAILEKTAPNGKLIAIDRDPDSIIRAKSNLKEFENRILLINDSFGNILQIVRKSGVSHIRGLLFDFGMSTSQLEASGRGFSFQKDEVLDMRYDIKTQLTAEDVLNSYSEAELFKIFNEFGEEPKAKIVAREIVVNRKQKRIKTTRELVEIIVSLREIPRRGKKVIRRHGKLHPATRIFQALRIEVNQELVGIERSLADIPKILSTGNRAAFISFHSLEDRLIKNWAKDLSKKNIIKILNKKPITVSCEELKINPKSRSAKLRVVEKI